MPFPLASPPSHYTVCSWPSNRCGIFYAGDTVTMTLSQATAVAYEVFDYTGTVVASGSVGGTSVTPTPPVGGWSAGWYRIRLTGSNTDSVYGDSYGASNFAVLRDDARFPPRPAVSVGVGLQGGGEARDLVTKGVLGIGSSRLQVSATDNPTFGADSISGCQSAANFANDYWADPTHAAYVDTVRPERRLMLQFPNRTFDRIEYTSGSPGFRVFIASASLDGSQVFVQVEAGSVSGSKYTVRFPNSSTIVETYDNIANAGAFVAATGSSAYIRAFGAGANPSPTGPTAIGKTFRDGIVQVVTALSAAPYNVMVYEGPVNEPSLHTTSLPHTMKLFQEAVHIGNASAKAIGPCPVEISDDHLDDWDAFLTAGGGDYCDEFSFHAYNAQTNGDINLGRHVFEGFLAKLAEHGQDGKPLWCTESTHVLSSIFGWNPSHNNGTYHPRRSRVPLLQTLLMEQYGIPREQNHVWYDTQHGFWSYPSWWKHSDASLNPYAVLYRTLAEETFEQAHDEIIDFGCPAANAIFLGSIYAEPAGASTAVIVSQSYMDDATVTLTVTGTSTPLTVVDGFGNEDTVAIVGGRAVVPVADIPTYVRLPEDVTVEVYAVLDWPPGGQVSLSAEATTATVGGTSASEIADDEFMTNYGAGAGIYISPNGYPEAAVLQWDEPRWIDKVVVFCGPVWQGASALLDFDVETTTDGTDWTVQATVTKTASSVHFGTDGTNAGAKVETFWDEQWIFPVGLGGAHLVTGIRVTVRETSYGGEPTFQAIDAGGQGSFTQHIALEEVMALEAVSAVSSAFSRPGIAGGGGGSAFIRYGGA